MTTNKYVTTLKQIEALVREALREVSSTETSKAEKRESRKSATSSASVSFEMNILAFMNKHARGLSGPQKFTLLIAYLVKGDLAGQASYQVIKAEWNKMKTVLGGECNSAHGNRAKARGWVEPEKQGIWKLTVLWKEALES